MNLLGELDKEEALLFTQLCGFIWDIADERTPLVYNLNVQLYRDHNITEATLHRLAHIGLAAYVGMGYIRRYDCPKTLLMHYFGRKMAVEFSQPGMTLPIGAVGLTQTGRELASIVDAQEVPGYFEMTLDIFNSTRSPVTVTGGASAVRATVIS